jgi:hypothetical protein
MYYAAAQRAASITRRIGKIPMKGKQEVVESGIGQQGLVQNSHPLCKIVDDDGESRTQ